MKQPAAFDGYADHYDDHFTQSRIGLLQRKQVWRNLLPYLTKPSRILEINCGTGADALRLATLGHSVLATDASSGMIRVCETKKKATEFRGELEFKQAEFQQLSDLLKEQKFDLIFSNFGGLNCVDQKTTRTLAAIFCRFLEPNGKLFFVYMSKGCLWEKWYYRYKGKPTIGHRRKSNGPIMVKFGDKEFPIWYYNPVQVRELYRPYFTLENCQPIGLFVPPSYLEGFFKEKKLLLQTLHWMDRRMARERWANYADHFSIVFKMRDTL